VFLCSWPSLRIQQTRGRSHLRRKRRPRAFLRRSDKVPATRGARNQVLRTGWCVRLLEISLRIRFRGRLFSFEQDAITNPCSRTWGSGCLAHRCRASLRARLLRRLRSKRLAPQHRQGRGAHSIQVSRRFSCPLQKIAVSPWPSFN
jgi:hypothetical protein